LARVGHFKWAPAHHGMGRRNDLHIWGVEVEVEVNWYPCLTKYSCECFKEGVADSRQWIILQFGDWGR